MDGNGNGYLSLAEVDSGMRGVISGAGLLASAKPAVMRAFQAAKGARSGGRPLGDDLIERGDEFRLFLLYLRRYLELLLAFDQLDTSGDRRLDTDEFEEACAAGILSDWGVHVCDPAREFAAIDLDGGGMILFDEFAHWALTRHLRLDGKPEEAEKEEEPPMPAAPNLASVAAVRGAIAASAAVRAADAREAERPAFADGGANALTARLAKAALSYSEETDGAAAGAPAHARRGGVIARVSRSATTASAAAAQPAVRSRQSLSADSADASAALEQPAKPKVAWGVPRSRAGVQRDRPSASHVAWASAGSGGAGQGPFRKTSSHQRVLFLIDGAVATLDNHSRRLVGAHNFAIAAVNAAEEPPAGWRRPKSWEPQGGFIRIGDSASGNGASAGADGSFLGRLRLLLGIAERIGEVATGTLAKIGGADGKRGRRSSVGGGGGSRAPAFKPPSTFGDEPSSGGVAGGMAALAARDALSRAQHTARVAAEKLRRREASTLQLAEGCEQSIAALHELHRVYARAIVDGSEPIGVTAAAAAAAAAATASVTREVRVVCSVEGDELCLYRSEDHATPF